MQATESPVTTQRLLEAASLVFAEHGFQKASIREICRRAHANVAAVHYHFGDKERLYQEVILSQFQATKDRFPFVAAADANLAPEDRLRAFLETFLSRLLEVGKNSFLGRIVAREMLDQSPVLDRVVQDLIRPQQQLLTGIVRAMLGPQAPDACVSACTRSVLAQCVFYLHSRPVIVRLYPELKNAEPPIQALTEHIYAFSLGGIAAAKARLAPEGKE
ncbi:MAG: CerR family C-terminal domain-containing protein [Planctomycetota bacterium]|nr:CerR family C-terminal domain-containing protein [Planctomycetota bacterium]